MQIGKTHTFEDRYMDKFRSIASGYGIFVEYARDAAGRDIGLHFTNPTEDGRQNVTPALAWFQMKGIMTGTLSAKKAKADKEVTLSLSVEHLVFWYMQPAPTYLVVYVEALDQFLVINIKRWVAEKFGNNILEDKQKSRTVKVRLSETLDEQAFRHIMLDNMIDTLKTALGEDEAEAKRFFRDAAVIKWLAKCKAENIQTRCRYTAWISKIRSEVVFEFCEEGEWKDFRNHWQLHMDSIESAFPFIEFTGVDEDEMEFYMEDEEDAQVIPLKNGSVSIGPNCSFEFYNHTLDIDLNAIGRRWARMLTVLENAGAISVATDTGGWVSVAPWHKRAL